MQPPSCAERHPILASVGVPVLAVIVAYWWSAAAVVVVAAAVCVSVMLQRWWRFEVAAHRKKQHCSTQPSTSWMQPSMSSSSKMIPAPSD
jgi:hypothetical protein